MTDKQKVVCKYCGSDDVLQDAYVKCNDPKDVTLLDDFFCRYCDGETSVITEDEYIYAHNTGEDDAEL